MKYFQILFFLITFQSITSAEIIKGLVLDTHYTRCIYNDFYLENDRYYSHIVEDNTWYSTSSDNRMEYLEYGYVYDTDLNKCYPDTWLILGMSIKDFNFLLGLIGVIIGGIFMFFTIQAFINVGGKK